MEERNENIDNSLENNEKPRLSGQQIRNYYFEDVNFPYINEIKLEKIVYRYVPESMAYLIHSSVEDALEHLIEITTNQHPIYETKELLLSNDFNTLLFWGKTLSQYTKKIKQHFLKPLRSLREEKSIYDVNSVDHVKNNILKCFFNFHEASLEKFEEALNHLQHDHKDFWKHYSSYNPLTFEGRVRCKLSKKIPIFELYYEYGMALYRFATVLQFKGLPGADVYEMHERALIFMFRIIQNESRKKKFTPLVFNKIVKVLECISSLNKDGSRALEYCDRFLIEFSNILMRGELKKSQINLNPLIKLMFSNNLIIRNHCKTFDLLEHLAKFFDTDFASFAAEKHKTIAPIYIQSLQDEEQLQKFLPENAKERLKNSKLSFMDYAGHIDNIIRILMGKCKPSCDVSFDDIDIQNEDESNWKLEDPTHHFSHFYPLLYPTSLPITEEENSNIYLGKNNSNDELVIIKVMKHFSSISQYIKKEISLQLFYSLNPNFLPLSQVYKFNDEVWVVISYPKGVVLQDIIPSHKLNEEEIAYIAKEILTTLELIHSSKRILRDLRSDLIYITSSGEVKLMDMELWLDSVQPMRYWIAPEMISNEFYRYRYEADVWSFGCVLIELVNRSSCSDFHPIKELFNISTKGVQIREKENYSPDFVNFVESATHVLPSSRATVSELLKHPFLVRASSKQNVVERINSH